MCECVWGTNMPCMAGVGIRGTLDGVALALHSVGPRIKLWSSDWIAGAFTG